MVPRSSPTIHSGTQEQCHLSKTAQCHMSTLQPNEKQLIAHILWQPSTDWNLNWLLLFYDLPEAVRAYANPLCKNISHYRRCGRQARFEFRCMLSSIGANEGQSIKWNTFWLPYHIVRSSKECSHVLELRNFTLHSMINLYDKDESESAFDSHSDDEGQYHPRLVKGKEHVLGRKPLTL